MGREYSDSDQSGEGNSPPFSLNWSHYVAALEALADFVKQHSRDTPSAKGGSSRVQSIPLDKISTSEQNRFLPVEGFFAFYSDLLGFSMEVTNGGMDSLPDFYGAAFVAAAKNPTVNAFFLSDTCMAFAPVSEAHSFIQFTSLAVSNWLADGLIPQCFIGYGSFVERKPDLGTRPSNFFGTQITGTALVDAANLQKNGKPLGSRILVSPSAQAHWPADQIARLRPDGEGNLEFFLERHPRDDLFDCIYYLLCLREHEPGTRAFNHYVWSFASRASNGKAIIPRVATDLASQYHSTSHFETVIHEISQVMRNYSPFSSQP